jgi:hypothetical protein
VVGPDERDDDVGSWAVVLEDLGVAKGYVVEASAEVQAIPGNHAALSTVLVTVRNALDECIRQADEARRRT